MTGPDDEGAGALRQLVVGVKPPEDDALEYVVHRFGEGISNPGWPTFLGSARGAGPVAPGPLVDGLVAAVRPFFGVVDQVELARRSALAGE